MTNHPTDKRPPSAEVELLQLNIQECYAASVEGQVLTPAELKIKMIEAVIKAQQQTYLDLGKPVRSPEPVNNAVVVVKLKDSG